jgi:hypothetical protein
MSLISRLFRKSPAAAAAAAPVIDERSAAAAGPDPQVLAREDEERLGAALAVGTRQALTDCVLHAHSTKARQRAAEHVSDPDHLRELIRLTRGGKDNSVYRLLTSKRAAQLSLERARTARHDAVTALLASLARRSRLPYDPLYEPAFALFQKDWAALAADAPAEAAEQIAEHLRTMQAVIERHHAALAAAAQARAAAETAAAAAAAEPAPAVAATVAAAAGLAEPANDGASVAANVAADVGAVAAEAPPPGPPTTASTVPVETELRAASVQPLISLLRQAAAALESGGTARAQRLRAALAETLAETPDPPAWTLRRLQQLDAKLAELKDWKTFTVMPKRADLVARMQSLVGAEISPDELARHIRRLQEEWRTLNRGAGDEDGAEAQSFRDAAQRAYEPCKQHFAREAALRQSNRARRESILERLAAVSATLDGGATDWRQLAKTIVEARREWRDYAPVDNAIAPVLQARLRAALADLQGRLDEEYARNVAAKRRLIEQAGRLMNYTDTRQAIEQAKELQKSWRTIGLVPRDQSDLLWDEFRGHCDAIFQRSAAEAARDGAALAASEARARALCEELETIAARTGDDLHSSMQMQGAMRAEFDALELPRKSARELRQRFMRAEGRCRDAVRREHAVAAQRAATALFDAASAIRAYAHAQLHGDDVDAARTAATIAMTALGAAPKAARTLLEQQFSKASAGELTGDLQANESRLRLLCVRAELVADVATPESDSAIRREYQLRRLLETKGLGADIALATVDELTLEWFTVGPVDPAVEAELRARFERCRSHG